MAFPSAKIILFLTVLILVSISRTNDVTVGITDTRLVWSGPNRYNAECGGIDSLVKNEMVSLNFAGESEPIFDPALSLRLLGQGINVTINFMTSNDTSSALISMDGGYVATIDTYNSSDSICQLLQWPSHSLSEAQHNVTVTGADLVFIHSFM